MLDVRSSVSSAAVRLAALHALVRASPIWPWPPLRLTGRAPRSDWPSGYDETDVRILEWIASQRREMLEQQRGPATSRSA